MQEGIGRGGYRILALVFAAIGVLGLVVTLYAFSKASEAGTPRGLFDWLGFALSFVGLAALYLLISVVLARRVLPGRSDAATSATFTPMPAGASVPGTAGAPTGRPIHFEFDDGAKAPEEDNSHQTGDELVLPAEPKLLERPAPVLPPNRNLDKDTKGWPQRKGPTGITRGQAMALKRGEPAEAMRTEVFDVAIDDTPARKSNGGVAAMLVRKEAPIVQAKLADPNGDADFTPDGMARGKCGNCSTLLLAPQERPIRLRCPKCMRVTTLG